METRQAQPSRFLLEMASSHEELVFLSLSHDFSIGLKRNICMHLASGSVICNFDDDDLYAPSYIEAMVWHLEKKQCDRPHIEHMVCSE